MRRPKAYKSETGQKSPEVMMIKRRYFPYTIHKSRTGSAITKDRLQVTELEMMIMKKYCYWCGSPVKDKYCENCGTDVDPPQDVYFLDEECGECNARLPRWAYYCTECGYKFTLYDPTDSGTKARYNKSLRSGLIFWSAIFILIAVIVPIASETIAFKHTLPVAAVLLIILWGITLTRTERGHFIDGTVTELFTRDEIHRERSLSETTITGRPVYYEVPVTVYCTRIRWDNGKEEVLEKDCNAADHIQLAVGDRMRYFTARRKYQKLMSGRI
ncbi:MAG: zinc ribbon domain-containing protein [Firmicutes bacterium]|nr:zinc ribbon domain-containing protein [Bacillota bacterium]